MRCPDDKKSILKIVKVLKTLAMENPEIKFPLATSDDPLGLFIRPYPLEVKPQKPKERKNR